jgi:hypothetical protein
VILTPEEAAKLLRDIPQAESKRGAVSFRFGLFLICGCPDRATHKSPPEMAASSVAVGSAHHTPRKIT